MVFQEGILLHLDKQACCASYSAAGTLRVWRAAQADQAMIPHISNCCVFGKYEGLYFIDYDDIHVFRHKDCDLDGSAEARFLRDLDYGELTGGDWIFDDLATQFVQQEVLDSFTSDFLRMFPNFSKTCPDLWISRSQKAILESPLFYLCLEDNNWSLAVELIQKEPPQGRSYAALQARC